MAEGGHSRSASYHTYKDLKCAYPRRVQPHKAPGGALPCCWGTCCTAPTPLRDFRIRKKTRGAQVYEEEMRFGEHHQHFITTLCTRNTYTQTQVKSFC